MNKRHACKCCMKVIPCQPSLVVLVRIFRGVREALSALRDPHLLQKLSPSTKRTFQPANEDPARNPSSTSDLDIPRLRSFNIVFLLFWQHPARHLRTSRKLLTAAMAPVSHQKISETAPNEATYRFTARLMEDTCSPANGCPAHMPCDDNGAGLDLISFSEIAITNHCKWRVVLQFAESEQVDPLGFLSHSAPVFRRSGSSAQSSSGRPETRWLPQFADQITANLSAKATR